MDSQSQIQETIVVNADWLKAHLHDDHLRIVDASWHMPAASRDARAEYLQGHIPGAVFFDLDEHSAASELPHTMPSAEQFQQTMMSLGIAHNHTIVVYDTVGLFSAPRVRWMFKHFGVRDVRILNGGLPSWLRSAGSLDSHDESRQKTTPVHPQPSDHQREKSLVPEPLFKLADVTDIKTAMHSGDCLIIDARSSGRFSGTEKEPRAGLRAGHIPGSVNVPFGDLLNEFGELKGVSDLKTVFDGIHLRNTTRVITTCGSGVTAAVLCLALECIGHSDVALYDGSWSEWGALADTPVATR